MGTKSLSSEEQRVSWLLEAFGQGVWEWNGRTGEVQFSGDWLRGLGYVPGEFTPGIEAWMALIHPDDVARVREAVDAHLAGRTDELAIEYRVRERAGGWRWASCRAKAVERGPDGRALRLIGLANDITAGKRVEETVRETTQMFSALFDASPVGIVALDADGLVRNWNAAAERLFGWSEAEVRGRPLPVVRPERQDAYARDWHEVLAGRRFEGKPRRALCKNGGVVDVRAFAVPLRSAAGAPSGVLVLLEDVTERKQLEMQLLQAQRLESIGQLAGAVAHDFNNLLTVINGYSEIALGSLDPRDPLHDTIGEIKSAGDRAAALTQQLLAFSRRQVMQPEVLSVATVLADAQSVLRRVIGDGIELVVTPGAAGHVKADPLHVQQVLMNLAANARDAMPGGGRLVIEASRVRLGDDESERPPGLRPGPHVLIAVTDTGAGMDEETLGRVFEPFFTTKEKSKGTGLGLSTVYGIVRQSGGHIAVHSRVGQGTTFSIYLPEVEAEERKGEVGASRARVASGSETILLVEDQPEVRQLALRALTLYGYRVLSAANGAEALEVERAETGAIDLLLSDVLMPGMTGPALAAAIVQQRPGIKVLLMSGYSDPVAMPRGEHGTVECVQKPFTPDGLARKVRQTLDSRGRGGRRVLVVDDEAEIRKLLRQFLEHAGYDVAEAANGRQAVDEVNAGGVSLVITDLVMPEQEGIETIREMRRRYRDVKIIAMSGAFGGRFLRTAEMLGAHATLSKPVRAEQLVRTVGQVLGAA